MSMRRRLAVVSLAAVGVLAPAAAMVPSARALTSPAPDHAWTMVGYDGSGLVPDVGSVGGLDVSLSDSYYDAGSGTYRGLGQIPGDVPAGVAPWTEMWAGYLTGDPVFSIVRGFAYHDGVPASFSLDYFATGFGVPVWVLQVDTAAGTSQMVCSAYADPSTMVWVAVGVVDSDTVRVRDSGGADCQQDVATINDQTLNASDPYYRDWLGNSSSDGHTDTAAGALWLGVDVEAADVAAEAVALGYVTGGTAPGGGETTTTTEAPTTTVEATTTTISTVETTTTTPTTTTYPVVTEADYAVWWTGSPFLSGGACALILWLGHVLTRRVRS